jgi:hypothetical protein
MLHFLSIGVEYPVIEVGVRAARSFDQQNLIAAHAEAAIGQTLGSCAVQRDVLIDRINHDEVVAGPLHLREP